jgi:hypothetical protein
VVNQTADTAARGVHGKPRIVYFAGVGRSGSTLLERMLGEVVGCVAVGEVCFLGERALVGRTVCGCGQDVRDCEFWRAVLQEFPDVERLAGDLAPFEDFGTNRGAWRQLAVWLGGDRRRCFDAYLAALRDLYGAVLRVGPTDTIVDSSKFPPYGAILAALGTFDVMVLHLVRDSRGVCYSWTKRQVYAHTPDGVVHMRQHGIVGSIARWWIYNVGAWLLGRKSGVDYIRVRYEDFNDDPQGVFHGLCERMGKPVPEGLFVSPHTVRLGSGHQLAGNPVRFTEGDLEIREDLGWQEGLTPAKKLLVRVLTFPLSRLLGY